MPRNYENWLQGYIELTKASESPLSFHFWTGVSTIAGALRRQVWIDQRYFQWTPNFYIILVGPAGIANKSTAMRAGVKFLERLKVPFGPQSMTWQYLTKSLQDSISTKKYYDGDGVEQKLIMSAITIPIGELGTFLKPEDGSLMDVLVSLWDGQLETWTHGTKTDGKTEILNPWINLIGCTTPSWLQNNFPEHMIGGGLTSRIIFVYGDKKRHYVAYPADHVNAFDYKETEEKLFLDLCEISTIVGEYHMTPEAKKWGSEWYQNHWENRPRHMASDRYGGYIARKQTHIHKLAMVLSAARRSKLIIEKEQLVEAEQLITSIEPDMQKVFSSIGLVDSARQMVEITSLVRSYGWISTQDLWKLCLTGMDQKTFRENIIAAVDAGKIKGEQRDGKAGVSIVN